MKKIIAFFNNYKNTARVMMGTCGFALICLVLNLIAFQLSGGKDKNGVQVTAFGLTELNLQKVGMAFFIVLVFLAILSITVLYRSVAYAFPKEKQTPVKSLPWISVACGAVEIIAAIFCVLVLTIDKTVIKPFWIINLVLLVLGGAANLCFIFVGKNCHYYMPALGTEKK